MNKKLFILDILDRHYCFYLDSKTNKMFAYGIKKDSDGYFVKNSAELNFLNKIIEQMNINKYIKRKDVLYNNEIYSRYVNKYNKKSYFAKTVDGNEIPCLYENLEELYDFYNNPKPAYIGRKNKPTYDYNFSFDNSHNYNYPNSTQSYGFFETQNNYGVNYTNSYQAPAPQKRKKIGTGAKITLIVSGIVVTVGLTTLGVMKFADGKVPDVSEYISGEQLTEETNTNPVEEQEEHKEHEKPKTSALVEEYGNVKLEPSTEEEIELQERYSLIQDQLKQCGLENWEISQELDMISLFNEHDESISFYYDTESNEIIYVYGQLEKPVEEVSEENSYNLRSLPKNTRKIVDAIQRNTNLTDEEKETIISIKLNSWIENEEYLDLDLDDLIQKYELLKIEYEYQEEGKEGFEREDFPYERASGMYSYKTGLRDDYSIGIKESTIHIFNGNNLEESLAKNDTVLSHELQHVDGDFSNSAILLREGYNALIQPKKDEAYINEQLMSVLFIETFGNDTMKEAFYSCDLENALANKIISSSNADNDTMKSVYDLLEKTQEFLNSAGRDENYRNNPETVKSFDEVCSELKKYYKTINGKEMEDNLIMSLIMNYISGRNDISILNDGEKISTLSYEKDGTLSISIRKENPKVEYEDGMKKVIGNTVSSRKVEISQEDKYNSSEEYKKVKDSDIDYITR